MKNLLLTLLLLPALAAAKVPVEEDIVAKTSDPDSPFYYTSLMMRYNVGDETLTDEDYHYLYSGYAHLSLTQIFMASIFIGASGAVMDLSVDITSAVHEVVEKRPDLSWQEAARSGLNVGRAAMGTMTTTLLFAYSGGYIALLMVFMAQGTPVDHILNYKYVAAEIIHTVIGSFGLVTVAPITALCAGLFLARRGGHPQPQKQTDG